MVNRRLLVPVLLLGSVAAVGCSSTGTVEHGKPFTLVVLPDTQCYCDTRLAKSAKTWGKDLREYFFIQTRWIRDNASRLNVAFVVHEGDITQTDYPEEWELARDAMSVVDGEVPYCLCLGNHDMGYRLDTPPDTYSTANDRSTLFNEYFPRSKFAAEPWFGGTYDDTHDNSYYTFQESGLSFLILSLEFKPRDEVLAWAGRIASQHPDHRVIVLTHSYLDSQNKRTVPANYEVAGNLGEGIWQKLVSQTENIFLVLCGHVLGEGRLTSIGKHGQIVHQLLCDYQGLDDGGASWLRYMTFHPLEDRIEVYTYNPARDEFNSAPSSRFNLSYPMLGAGAGLGITASSAR